MLLLSFLSYPMVYLFMAMSLRPAILSPKLHPSPLLPPSKSQRNHATLIQCAPSQPSELPVSAVPEADSLQIGSPIVIVEAPPTLKTAASMPTLRVNAGLVKPGDVGRIIARKPKDVWAVRLAIGTYLIDGKHFKPLDVDEDK